MEHVLLYIILLKAAKVVMFHIGALVTIQKIKI